VRETGVSTPFPGELFVKRYGITPAECSVLMVLAQGKSPNEIAEILGLSLPTVKTHLAHLFAKTETRGQADLVRLALTSLGPAALPG
jgi:DNA-binding CsgD family transcriptional regulator